VSADPVQTSALKAKKARKINQASAQEPVPHAPVPLTELNETPVALTVPPAQDVVDTTNQIPESGLAAAIARARETK
jgi:hypothetical protein